MKKEIMEKLLEKIESLETEIVSLKKDVSIVHKNQIETHKNQEKVFQNQIEITTKLDTIKQFEAAELEELKDIEAQDERDLINDRFGKSNESFHQLIVKNVTQQMAKDEWLTKAHRKIIEYAFSFEKYNPSKKRFEGSNFSEVVRRCHINRRAAKDHLIKLVEENYLLTRQTSDVDEARINYRGNVLYFKYDSVTQNKNKK